MNGLREGKGHGAWENRGWLNWRARLAPEPRPVAEILEPPGQTSSLFGRKWLYGAALLVLAGFLLFCHGCHGDEDNELLATALNAGEFSYVKVAEFASIQPRPLRAGHLDRHGLGQ